MLWFCHPVLWINFGQKGLIKASATEIVGATFDRQRRRFIFIVSPFDLPAGRATIMGYDNPNVFNSRVVLKALEGNSGG